MKTLLLDTAASIGWIALGETLVLLEEGPLHSHELGSRVSALLDKAQLTPNDLDLIGVGIGPGSYTGIRVAAALAKGLNLGAGVPLAGFCSLSAYFPEDNQPFIAAFDARGGGVYVRDSKTAPAKRVSLEEFLELARKTGRVISPDRERLIERTQLTEIDWPKLAPYPAHARQEVEASTPSCEGVLMPIYSLSFLGWG